MSNRHCWKTKKEVEGPERLYRRWPFSWPLEEKGWWGNGSGRSWGTDRADGAGRANHPRRFAPIRGPTPPPSQSITNLASMSPNRRRAAAARLQLRNAKSLTACKTDCQARCDICSMNQYHLLVHGSKDRARCIMLKEDLNAVNLGSILGNICDRISIYPDLA